MTRKRLFFTTLFFTLYSLLLVTACNKKKGESLEISMSEFSELYKKNSAIQILDVRTPEEYNEGHVPNARLLTLNNLVDGSQSVPFDKNSEIYIICRSGNRSMTATKFLKQAGYEHVASVAGGTMGWISEGNPIQKEEQK